MLEKKQLIVQTIEDKKNAEFLKHVYNNHAEDAALSIRSFERQLSPLTTMDIVHEVFADLRKKPVEYFKATTIRQFLKVSCRNKALGILRKKKIPKVENGEVDLVENTLKHSSTIYLFDDSEKFYLSILAPQHRNVWLDYLEGYKLREIAERRNLNLSTVKSYKRKAEHRLRSYLAEHPD